MRPQSGFACTHRRRDGRKRVHVRIVQPDPKRREVVLRTFPRRRVDTGPAVCGCCRCRSDHQFLPVRPTSPQPSFPLSLGSLSCTSHTCPSNSLHHGPNRTPIELVKCKMQVQMLLTPPASPEVLAPLANTGAATLSAPSGSKPHKLPGPIAVLKSVVQTSGLRGLWLGQTGTLIRETGGGAAWFVSKEAVARLLISRRPSSSSSASTSTTSSDGGPSQKQHLAVWESAVSGGFAGLAYNVALFPADTVKSAVQTEAEMRPRAPGEPYPSFVATARAMYKAQGLRGLYAGCGITAARAVPSSALIFVIYDGLTKRFG